MKQVQRASAERKGETINEDKLEANVQRFRDSVVNDSRAYRTSAYGLDDGIIDPRDTRDVLGMCLEVVSRQGVKGAELHRGLARM